MDDYSKIHYGDQLANFEDTQKSLLQFYEETVKRLFINLPEGASVLDLGAGSCLLGLALRKFPKMSYQAVEPDEYFYASAKSRGLNVYKNDALTFLSSLESETIDCVFCKDLIEHLSLDDFTTLVIEINRVLKPGGIWVSHQPNPDSPWFSGVFFSDLTHVTAYSSRLLDKYLRQKNFKDFYAHEDFLAPGTRYRYIRKVLWLVVKQIYKLAIIAEPCPPVTVFSRNYFFVVKK